MIAYYIVCFFSSCFFAPTMSLSSSLTNKISASLRGDKLGNNDDASFKMRRGFVLADISVLPFLQFKSPALGDNEITTSNLNQETEVAVSEGTSPYLFLSLLNGFGIFSAGVLDTLYALARQDTQAAEEIF